MELKDVIHYYLEQEYLTPNSQGEINSYTLRHIADYIKDGKEVQPVLRKLEDLTEEEGVTLFGKEKYWDVVCREGQDSNIFTPEQFHYLLSRGFDLFSLIPSGQAIDAKTINK